MTQRNPSDFPINPSTTSGTNLADINNRATDAIDTMNAGASRPQYAKQGTVWLNNTQPTALLLNMYTGSADATLFTINGNTGEISQGVSASIDLTRNASTRGQVSIESSGSTRWIQNAVWLDAAGAFLHASGSIAYTATNFGGYSRGKHFVRSTAGSSDLTIEASAGGWAMRQGNGAGTASNNFIAGVNGAAVELYHNNNKKAETASYGVTVTGEVRTSTGSTNSAALQRRDQVIVNNAVSRMGGTATNSGKTTITKLGVPAVAAGVMSLSPDRGYIQSIDSRAVNFPGSTIGIGIDPSYAGANDDWTILLLFDKLNDSRTQTFTNNLGGGGQLLLPEGMASITVPGMYAITITKFGANAMLNYQRTQVI